MKITCILSLVLFLGATDSRAGQGSGLGLSSIVSTTDPRFRVLAGTSVVWKESAVKVYLDDQFDSQTITSIYRAAIESAIGEKGYRLATAGDDTDFELGFLLALSSNLDDDQIMRQFGFSPGLQGSPGDNRPKKGTLVIILIDPRNGRSMWRGAIQAFANPGASDDERQQRAKSAVGKLIGLMPDVP